MHLPPRCRSTPMATRWWCGSRTTAPRPTSTRTGSQLGRSASIAASAMIHPSTAWSRRNVPRAHANRGKCTPTARPVRWVNAREACASSSKKSLTRVGVRPVRPSGARSCTRRMPHTPRDSTCTRMMSSLSPFGPFGSPMSNPGVCVRWFCQAQMSASRWGPWGRGPAMGRVVGGPEHAVNLGERHPEARGRTT